MERNAILSTDPVLALADGKVSTATRAAPKAPTVRPASKSVSVVIKPRAILYPERAPANQAGMDHCATIRVLMGRTVRAAPRPAGARTAAHALPSTANVSARTDGRGTSAPILARMDPGVRSARCAAPVTTTPAAITSTELASAFPAIEGINVRSSAHPECTARTARTNASAGTVPYATSRTVPAPVKKDGLEQTALKEPALISSTVLDALRYAPALPITLNFVILGLEIVPVKQDLTVRRAPDPVRLIRSAGDVSLFAPARMMPIAIPWTADVSASLATWAKIAEKFVPRDVTVTTAPTCALARTEAIAQIRMGNANALLDGQDYFANLRAELDGTVKAVKNSVNVKMVHPAITLQENVHVVLDFKMITVQLYVYQAVSASTAISSATARTRTRSPATRSLGFANAGQLSAEYAARRCARRAALVRNATSPASARTTALATVWAAASVREAGRESFATSPALPDFTVKSADSLARLALTETANVTRWMDSARVSRATWEFAVKSLAPKELLDLAARVNATDVRTERNAITSLVNVGVYRAGREMTAPYLALLILGVLHAPRGVLAFIMALVGPMMDSAAAPTDGWDPNATKFVRKDITASIA